MTKESSQPTAAVAVEAVRRAVPDRLSNAEPPRLGGGLLATTATSIAFGARRRGRRDLGR